MSYGAVLVDSGRVLVGPGEFWRILVRSGELLCSFGVVWGVHVASGESWWVLVISGIFWVQFWCVLVWFLWVLVSSGGLW